MSGFDFELICSTQKRSLAKGLLYQLQKRGDGQEVSVRFHWRRSYYYAAVNGPLPAIQSFFGPTVPFLFGFAEAFPTPGRADSRRRLCRLLVSEFSAGVSGISELVGEIAEEFGATPNSYFFDVGSKTHLTGTMATLTNTLLLYQSCVISAPQLAEQSHTSLELLLKTAVQCQDGSFEALARAAGSAGLLSSEAVSAILKLKNLRRRSKHRGQGISPSRLNELVPTIVSSAHGLLKSIRSGTLAT